MEFDVSKVYSAVNAEELKVGSKIFVADNLEQLKAEVKLGIRIYELTEVQPDNCQYRFSAGQSLYNLAYLVEEPAKLKWTDLKVGDVIHRKGMIRMVIGIDSDTSDMHILINNRWLDDEELESWEKVENEDDD